MNTEPTTRRPAIPPLPSSDWLALAYSKAGELHTAFETAQWSRSMTRRDQQTIGQLHAKAQNLMNMIYRATQANYLFKRKEFGLSAYWPRNAELLATAQLML